MLRLRAFLAAGARFRARAWPRFARSAIGWALALVLLGCAAATALVAAYAWNLNITLDQRLAALGAIFAAGAFSLAIIGSVVALLAYRIAIQRPTLVVHITTADSGSQRWSPVRLADIPKRSRVR